MTTPVVLGIDPNKRHLGLALVEFEPPFKALWADTVSINEPNGGWRHRQIMRALADAPETNFTRDCIGGYWSFDGRDVVRFGIELPPWVNNTERFRELCEVYADCVSAAHRRWPWAIHVPLSPPAWKKAVLGKGNATKSKVYLWAHLHAFDEQTQTEVALPGQDACDALAIAVAAAKLELEDESTEALHEEVSP